MLVVGDGVQFSAWAWAASVGVGLRPLDWDCRKSVLIGDGVVGTAPPICDTKVSVGEGEGAGMMVGVDRTKLAGKESCDADGRKYGIGSNSSRMALKPSIMPAFVASGRWQTADTSERARLFERPFIRFRLFGGHHWQLGHQLGTHKQSGALGRKMGLLRSPCKEVVLVATWRCNTSVDN